MRQTVFLLLIIFTLHRCFAGTTASWESVSKNEVLEKYRNALDWFTKTPAYSVNVKYASFMDHTTTVAYDKSDGIFIRDGKNMHTVVIGLKTIQNERFRFTVNDEEQLIMLNNLSPDELSPVDMSKFSELLDNVVAIKKQSVNGATDYQVQFKPNGLYSSFEFEITEKGMLSKITYFYSSEMTEENDEEDASGKTNKDKIKGKPRMEISFYNYQANAKIDYTKEFSEKEYFRAEGKKLVLSEKYKNYELKDYRSDPNK